VRLYQDGFVVEVLTCDAQTPLISFYIQWTFYILPCPSNLFRWKLSTDSLCTLCKTPSATVSHILSGCKVALKQGRYTYRHDDILAGIVKCLRDFLAIYNPSLPSEDDNINFVKAGGKCSSVPKSILVFCTRQWLEIVFWFWGSKSCNPPVSCYLDSSILLSFSRL